jgi:predicted dehydrogenase
MTIAADDTDSEQVSVALVGCGYRARTALLPAIAQLNRTIRHVTLVDHEIAAGRAGCRLLEGTVPATIGTLDSVLEDERHDAVILATPTHTHASLLEQVTSHRSDMLVLKEKPAFRIRDVSDQGRQALHILFDRAYMPINDYVKALLARRRITSYTVRFERPCGDYTNDWRNASGTMGSVEQDMGSHTAEWIVGNFSAPDTVTLVASPKRRMGYVVAEEVSFRLWHRAENVEGHLHLSRLSPVRREEWHVHGPDLDVRWSLNWYESGQQARTVLPFTTGWARVEAVRRMLRDRLTRPPSVQDTMTWDAVAAFVERLHGMVDDHCIDYVEELTP